MALAYLLDPVFEIQNSAGKPATNGWLEVYVHGSRERYYCASDFDGTLHPFKIPLDSLGSNIVLADDDKSYDVYVYNRYGSLLMSRYAVTTGAGNLVRIVSGDGSIDVTWTDNGHIRTYDIRQAEDGEDLLDWFKSIGSSRIEDTTIYRPGCTSGTMEMGEYGPRAGGSQYYHATAHVLAVKTDTEPYYDKVLVRFYARSSEGVLTLLESSSCIVDWSQGLTQEFDVSCDLNIASDCEICVSIEGQDVNAGGFELANFYLHRVYSGTPRIPSGVISRAEVTEELEGKQDVIDDLSEIRAGAEAGATAVQPGDLATVATSGSYNDLSNKPDLSGFATKSEVTSGLASKQDTLIAGNNITIVDNVISATGGGGGGGGGTTYTAGDGIDIDANNEISAKVDGTTITVNASGELEAIGGGTGSQVQANWAETDPSDPSYIENKPSIPTATSDLTNDSGYITSSDVPAAQEQADWNELDTTDPAYIKNKPTIPAAQVNSDWTASSGVAQILNKPTIPSATSDLTNDSGYITSSDVPGAQVQSDWTESDTTDPSYIQNKPTIPAAQVNSDWTASSGVAEILHKPTIPSATSDLTNDSGFITTSDVPAAQEQADWNESDTTDPAYIKNKPTIPAAQVNADWTASSGVAEILHKPSIPSATSDLTNDSGFITASDVPSAQAQADWNESDTTDPSYIQHKPVEKSIVAGSGISITEDVSNVTFSATVDQTYNSSSTNAQSGAAVAGALATVNQVPASTALDEDKVLTVNSSGTPVWAASQGGGGTVDQTYNSSSTNAQSGTAVAGALATVNQVPASTALDENKALVVNSSGVPVWSNAVPLSTDVHAIELVNSLPASPVSGTLYLIPET